jgi:hypothetical protein
MTDESAEVRPLPDQPIDRFGALASTLCAVHCVVSAFLPELLATVGLGVLLGHESEWGFTLVALGLASAALWLGWRKHRSVPVLLLFGAGIAALLLARLLEDGLGELVGTTLSVVAGLTLVGGHFWNSRAGRRAGVHARTGSGARPAVTQT